MNVVDTVCFLLFSDHFLSSSYHIQAPILEKILNGVFKIWLLGLLILLCIGIIVKSRFIYENLIAKTHNMEEPKTKYFYLADSFCCF